MIKILNEITYVNARKILEVIYPSKPRDTILKWRQIRKNSGMIMSGASNNALIKIMKSGVITKRW